MRDLYISPIIPITLTANKGALTGLYFGDILKEDREVTEADSEVLTLCRQELDSYFKGKLKKFTVPLNLEGTPFRKKVWEALLQIPYGETLSYKDISIMVDNPKAFRAVGGANHNNPVSIIVPCHRVIGSDGSLTGYGGGIENKKWLLDFEKKHI